MFLLIAECYDCGSDHLLIAKFRLQLKKVGKKHWASQVVLAVKKPSAKCKRDKRLGFDPWVGKIPWNRAWQPTKYSCLEKPMDRGAWKTVDPQGHKESDTTEVT